MEDTSFRPLKLLNSLFSERVDFLRNALEELYKAESDRLHYTRNAMEDLDSDISRCQQELDLMIGARSVAPTTFLPVSVGDAIGEKSALLTKVGQWYM
ncbi:hypothetical protein ES702_00433 [subsurface metagenome]